MNQNQMIAIVRTLLYFMGKQMYMPTSTDVLPILMEAMASQPLSDPKSAPLVWNTTPQAPTTSATNTVAAHVYPSKQQRAR